MQQSGRLLTVLLLLIITFCFAMFQGGFVSWFVFFVVLPFLLYAILLAVVPLKIVQVSRIVEPSKVSRGGDAKVTVTFRVESPIPLIYMTVSELPVDHIIYETAKEHATKLFLVGQKRQFEWTYELSSLERGEHFFEGLKGVFTDFFGWTFREMEVKQQHKFIVYPKMVEMQSSSIRVQYDQGTLASPFSIVKDTSVVTGVRDYQPGDRFSWIHWKSFAKNGALRTKEFEDKQSQNLFVLLDRSSEINFEEAIDFTASLLQAAVKRREEISFLSAGMNRFFYPSIRTEGQFEKTLQHLAVVQPDATFAVQSLLQTEQQLMRRSVVVLVVGTYTDAIAQLMMNAATYAVAIICFVVTEEVQSPKRYAGNHQVIFVAPSHFDKAFTEVAKQ